jgi:hypothetical protein
MSLIKDKVAEVMKALGDNCSYQKANQWMTKKYGDHGISDGTFYNARSDIRLRGGAIKYLEQRQHLHPVQEAPPENTNPAPVGEQHSVPMQASQQIECPVVTHLPLPGEDDDTRKEKKPQPVVKTDVTLAEVRKVAALVREIGEGRLLSALQVLRELR